MAPMRLPKHAHGAYDLSTTASGGAFQYVVLQIDAERGLYHHQAPYYRTSFGRSLQTDPTGTLGSMRL